MGKIFNTTPIDNYIEQHKVTKAEFCRRCEIPYRGLLAIYAHRPRVRYEFLFAVCDFLEVTMDYLLGINIKN